MIAVVIIVVVDIVVIRPVFFKTKVPVHIFNTSTEAACLTLIFHSSVKRRRYVVTARAVT